MVTSEQGIDMEALEGMVDRHGLRGVLEMLAEVCTEKEEHLRTNWQDHVTAGVWKRNANKLVQSCIPKIEPI